MISVNREQDCCGCTACEQTCKRHAITMKSDKKGFLYPVVNESLCNGCNLCNNICPIQIELEERIPNHTYAVKNRDVEIRRHSSSGGLFTILATKTISEGGVVYGAIFDEGWSVVHSRVDQIEDIQKLRGSKYVQSNLKNSFKQVKEDLLRGVPVLFSGTPCQVSGLLHFLRKAYQNLTTVDFVCHGVPNPQIWRDYLNETIATFKAAIGKSSISSSLNRMSSIKDIRFRDKSNGWKKFRFVMELAETSTEGKQSSVSSFLNDDIWDNDYMRLFLDNYILRPSCHECHFRNGKSGSDYTIADYWQIVKFLPEFDDDKGVSMLLSYNGMIPAYIVNDVEYIETPFEHACFGNRCIKSDWPYNRASIFFYFFHNQIKLSLRNSMVFSYFCNNKLEKMKSLMRRLKSKLL